MKLSKSNTAKLIAGLVGVALAISFVVPAAAGAQTAMASYTFNTNLRVGSRGTDVRNLQKVLNMSADTQVAASGPGSPGNETSSFGRLTKAAVIKFQTKFGISPAAGYVGPVTRAKLNSMGSVTTTSGATTTTTTGGTTTATTGTTATTTAAAAGSLTVAATTQPVNTLAPQSANRIPFTNFSLTAGASDVAVNSVTVQRTGLAQDAVFSGIVLIDAGTGSQIGIAKTLNSNHQAVVGTTFTVPAGTTKNLIVAGNMAASLSSYTGQLAGLSVVAVNTSANVSGSLPINGAQQTVNSSLTLGAATISVSSYDPNNGPTALPIGTTAYRISGFRVTAGSAEDLTLKSIAWNETGSAGSADLANVVTIVNGTSYPTSVSTDGKYYTTVFPSAGVVISKGNSVDLYVQGDIVGSGSAGRTVEFDVYKNTDLYLVGNTYGYGITAPTGSNTTSTAANHATTINTNTNPWFQGSQATISAGTVTTIAKANEVAAQNIAANVSGQPLGGFATNFAGEPVTVQSMYFEISTTTTLPTTASAPAEAITSISLVNQSGAVVAGPVDAALADGSTTHGGTVSAATSYAWIKFTDTVTFPVGRQVYTLKGKIPSDWVTGTTVAIYTKPSVDWTTVTGQTTGNTISLSGQSTVLTANTMTVKAAALTVNLSSQPAAQNVVAGAQNLVFANYQLDATASGEDVRMSSFPVTITATAAADLTGCQLWQGTKALNTGNNVINTFTSGTAKTFSFDSGLTVPKGTIVTLALACNVGTGAATNDTFNATADTTNGDYSITGVTSGNSVTTSAGLTLGTPNGSTMTVTTGSMTDVVDSSSPSFALVAGGTTGQTVAVIKLRASNEPINITKIGLILTKGSTTDLTNSYIYSGSTLLGTATFTGTNLTATTTLPIGSPFLLPRDVDTLLTVKADFANVGISQSGVQGKQVIVDPVNIEGTGVNSGKTITANATAAAAGVRVYKSYPTLALDTSVLGTSGIADGRLMRFKVTATSNGAVGLAQIAFKVSTTSANVTNINLYGYTDPQYSQPVSGQGAAGLIGSQISTAVNATAFFFQTATTTILQVPAGQTLYFELRASVTGVVSGSSVVTTLLGDSTDITSYTDASRGFFVATATQVQNNFNLVWSGNATGTAAKTDVDWTTGYTVPGLPSSGLIMTRSN